MCDHCGCSEEDNGYTLINPADKTEKNMEHHHDHPHNHYHDHHHHDHPHTHHHDHHHDSHDNGTAKRITIETDILQKNNLLAQRNKGYFEAKSILALNMVSSPGSGKTTILERTINELKHKKVCVIEGDQQTALDADRIHQTGAPVIQVNTGNGCHLDSDMINKAVKELNPENNSVLFIENVGNLVCPALFDLGEQYRIVITSVTEGEDKPLKYPNMFQTSQLCIINKVDLLPHLNFNTDKFREYALRVNSDLQFIEISALKGDGFKKWITWIEDNSGK